MIVIDDPDLVYDLQPRHGADGWVLEDMDWDPETGISRFEYSNTEKRGTVWVVHRAQPTTPDHVGWIDREFQNVLSLE